MTKQVIVFEVETQSWERVKQIVDLVLDQNYIDVNLRAVIESDLDE